MINFQIIKILEKKGWALYHAPFTPLKEEHIKSFIRKGREKNELIPFESYLVLPLIFDDKNDELLLKEVDKCFENGRLPWFIKFDKNFNPKFICCVDSIGIGYNNSILLIFDLNTTYHFQKIFNFPDPLSIEDRKLNFQFFNLTYETNEISELNNIISRIGKSIIKEKIKFDMAIPRVNVKFEYV